MQAGPTLQPTLLPLDPRAGVRATGALGLGNWNTSHKAPKCVCLQGMDLPLLQRRAGQTCTVISQMKKLRPERGNDLRLGPACSKVNPT